MDLLKPSNEQAMELAMLTILETRLGELAKKNTVAKNFLESVKARKELYYVEKDEKYKFFLNPVISHSEDMDNLINNISHNLNEIDGFLSNSIKHSVYFIVFSIAVLFLFQNDISGILLVAAGFGFMALYMFKKLKGLINPLQLVLDLIYKNSPPTYGKRELGMRK